jgi:hypothetical protein
MKRAVLQATAHGLATLGLSQRLLSLVFDRMLEVDASAPQGERGGAIARAAERMPLSTAERRLRDALESVLRERAEMRGIRAFVARKIQAAALERIEKATLRAFRSEESAHGGVDLARVRDTLSTHIDAMVLDAVRAASMKVTVLFVVGYAGATLLFAFGLSYVFGEG